MQPHSADSNVDTAADFGACRALLRDGSRTFHAASFLLPRRVREPASALYAFCRLADDAVDVAGGGVAAIGELRERVDCIYAGHPRATGVDRAFAGVVARHDIPSTLLDALLEGFTWDATGRRYEDLDALYGYAARVAGTVGAMMTIVMGTRSRDAVARACDLGVAMQLSNIARDVGEDARAGRLYLPLAWMRAQGIDPEAWLASPAHSTALGNVVQRLLDAAERLYRRSAGGIAQLPLGCRPGINAARVLYAEIGREVERQGHNAITRRAVVAPTRKATLLIGALSAGLALRQCQPAPPLPETAFLVDAVTRGSDQISSAPGQSSAAPPWWNLGDRIVWTLDLFGRLEQREAERAGSGD